MNRDTTNRIVIHTTRGERRRHTHVIIFNGRVLKTDRSLKRQMWRVRYLMRDLRAYGQGFTCHRVIV
jgi:hypothetical protein